MMMDSQKQHHSDANPQSQALADAGYSQTLLSHRKFAAYVNMLAVIGAVLSVYFVWQLSPPVSIWVVGLILFAGLLVC
jgi:hypothetical protein